MFEVVSKGLGEVLQCNRIVQVLHLDQSEETANVLIPARQIVAMDTKLASLGLVHLLGRRLRDQNSQEILRQLLPATFVDFLPIGHPLHHRREGHAILHNP